MHSTVVHINPQFFNEQLTTHHNWQKFMTPTVHRSIFPGERTAILVRDVPYGTFQLVFFEFFKDIDGADGGRSPVFGFVLTNIWGYLGRF